MRSCLIRCYWRRPLRSGSSILNIRWRPPTSATSPARTDSTRTFTRSFPRRKRSPNNLTTERPNGPEAWIALLDRSLPHHLRLYNDQSEQADPADGNISDIILTAQRLSENGTGIDLLYHFGEKQGRWRAVVWLVKHMVETIASPPSRPARLSATLNLWTSHKSLSDVTHHNSAEPLSPQRTRCPSQSLDDLTGSHQPEEIRKDAAFKHDVLGSLWRTLGLMTIACADGELKPQVLEIIAYLHHMEIMPSSIYSQNNSADPTAIQQPPMLRLFSSTILTSLSDAAWRAHEKTVAEEASAKSGQHLTTPPNLPGAAVRMTSPGLRPEVWIELILWSCLHGGWILEGAATLRSLYSESKRPRWRPLSWSSVFRASDTPEDWDKLLGSLFNVRHAKRREQTYDPSSISVRRTVSSEVVNAYVDALLTAVRSGVGKRGAASSTVLEYLSILRRFLQRAGLGLQSGSWDAIVLRFFDSQEFVIEQAKNFETLMSLSPGLGEGINATNHDRIPQYVLDGSAATLGLFHRALRSRIARGDAQSALRLFECLQSFADQNKHRSLVDFFEKSKLLVGSKAQADSSMFTSNFPGIEYPALNVQIPPTILGPFLELLTDAKAYDWGRWLLYNDDGFDEAILSESHYNHPAVAPALVRFASETRDSDLLVKAIQARSTTIKGDIPTKLTGSVLQSFVESQINLNNWRAAERVLQHDQGLQAHSVNTATIAHLIRSMLLQTSDAAMRDTSTDQIGPRSLLTNILQGKYDKFQTVPTPSEHDRATLLLILLATINQELARYCVELRPLGGAYSFSATPKEFNFILDGVVHAYGSSTGRRFVQTFWRSDVSNALSQYEPRERVMDRFNPDLSGVARRNRFQTAIPGNRGVSVTIYGGLRPNAMTMRTILRQALEEMKDGKEGRTASETVIWAVKALDVLQETEALESAKLEIQSELSKSDLDKIWPFTNEEHGSVEPRTS